MTKDELLRQIVALPEGTEIGVRFGREALDIVGVTASEEPDLVFVQCYQGDVEAVLRSVAEARR